MPRELFPSSYVCDCGHQSDFSENTIREAKYKSHKKRLYLLDSARDEHTIVFAQGEMITIICPQQTTDPRETATATKKPKRGRPYG